MGGVPHLGIFFRKSDAIHRARFMARLIYALKIFLFRYAEFKLAKQEIQGLEKFCVGVYVKSWFLSRLPKAAPANDLRILKLFVQIDSPEAKGVLRSFVASSGTSARS